MQQAPRRRRFYGGHVLPLSSVLRSVISVYRLRDYIRIFLVAVTFTGARVVLRDGGSTCGKRIVQIRKIKYEFFRPPPLSLNVGPLIEPLCSELFPVETPFLFLFLRSSLCAHWTRSTKMTTRATISRAEMTPIKTLIIGVKRNADRWLSERKRS